MSEIDRSNRALRDLGLNPFGEGLYKWVQASEVFLFRKRWNDLDKWELKPISSDGLTKLWLPCPFYEKVPAFAHLGQRWFLGIWQDMPEQEWTKQFGNRAICPPSGLHFPTDKVMKPGKTPSLDVTEYFMACIRRQRQKSFADLESELQSEMDREERSNEGRLYDMIQDACTAFGNDPGKRSGGVSFPTPQKGQGQLTVCQ